MKPWKKVIFGILTISVLLFGIVTLLLSTTAGIRFMITAVSCLVPELKVGKVTTTDNRNVLCLKDVQYEKSGFKIHAEEVHLATKLRFLLKRNLFVNDLVMKNVYLTINSKKIPNLKKINEWRSKLLDVLKIHFAIFKRVRLNNIHIAIGSTTISAKHFYSGFYWKEKNFILFPTILQEVLITTKKNEGTVNNRTKKKISYLHSEQKYSRKKELRNLLLPSIFSENTILRLPINLNIQKFTCEKLRLISGTNLEIHHLFFKANSINSCIQINALDVLSNWGTFHVTGSSKLHRNWPIEMVIRGVLNNRVLKGEKIIFSISGELRDSIDIKASIFGFSDMMLRSKIWLAKKGIPLKLEVISKQFYYLLSKKEIQTNELKMRISGKINNYALSFFTKIKGNGIPPSVITLNAKGNEKQIIFNKLAIKTLEGAMKLVALFDWKKDFSWRSEMKLDNINIEKKNINFPLKLNGLIKVNGGFDGKRWYMTISELKLIGSLKENYISIFGALKCNGCLQWIASSLRTNNERNRCALQRKSTIQELNLTANMHAPRLDKITSRLSGAIKGTLKIHDSICESCLSTNIIANNIKWKKLTMSHARIGISMQFENQIKGRLGARFEKINKPKGTDISLATLSATGSEKKHILRLYMQGKSVSGQLQLKGTFDRQIKRWKGELDRILFSTSPSGAVAPDMEIKLDCCGGTEKKNISNSHRLKNTNTKFFFSKSNHLSSSSLRTANYIAIATNSHRYNLVIPKIFLLDSKSKILLDSSVTFSENSNFLQNTKKEEKLKNNLKLYRKNIKMNKEISGRTLTLSFDVLRLNIWIRSNCVEIGWLTRLANKGQINGKIKISEIKKRRDLRGNVSIQDTGLTVTTPFFSSSRKERGCLGILNANLVLEGTLKSPKLFGKVKVSNVDVKSSFASFDTQPNQLTINFKGMHCTYLGTMRTREGEISVSGNMKWSKLNKWNAYTILKGRRIRLTAPSIGILEISPNIILRARPDFFSLDGHVEIPWARILVRKVPDSTISVSEDEIILDRNRLPLEVQSKGIPIRANLVMHVGNDVYLDAFGMKAKLTGDLQVTHNEEGFSFNGQINLPEGRFHAYGQDLVIRKGALFFSRSLNHPIIDIEAVRNPDLMKKNVIAGIRITSSINKPKVDIFSDPEMSQQEAVSYLLRGQSANEGQNNSATITSMLVGLGIAQGDQVVSKVGKKFGVNNLMLDTKEIGDSSKIIISGYLLPDLQIKYGVGILDSLATLVIQYRLIPKLYLEAISGINQEANLLYQFEF